MGKLNQMKVNGFRRLRDVDINFKGHPLTVLIGPNSVGKTSFLDAVSLLTASARGCLNESLSAFGGIAQVLTRGQCEKLSLDVDMEIPGSPQMSYMLELAAEGHGYGITHETLLQREPGCAESVPLIDSTFNEIRYYESESRKLVQPNWKHSPLESSLCQVPKMFSQSEKTRQTLADTLRFGILDTGHRSPIKLPQELRPASSPGLNGETLVPFLYNLREMEDNFQFEMVTDTLRAAFPNFKELSFPAVAAGMLALTWKDSNFKMPFYAHELSAGTLRFLWIISILSMPKLPTVTMIDEPDVSLHPDMLRILVNCMREASRRTQLIVVTHSARLVHFLRPEEIAVVDMDEEGCASVAWADTMDLEKWLEDHSLDELWHRGELKGWS
jgi:predicted ATPase